VSTAFFLVISNGGHRPPLQIGSHSIELSRRAELPILVRDEIGVFLDKHFARINEIKFLKMIKEKLKIDKLTKKKNI
jgi:hypothetical protein